jgi:hypothetical protein
MLRFPSVDQPIPEEEPVIRTLAVVAALMIAATVVWTSARAQEATPVTACAYVDTSPIVLRGTGNAVSDPFSLNGGNINVLAQYDQRSGEGIWLSLYEWPGDAQTIVFVPWQPSERTMAAVPHEGTYVAEVEVRGIWTITIEQ